MTSDSVDRATQLLAMTQRLVTLMGEEVEAVKTRKLQGPSAEWDEKERLVHAWRIEVRRLRPPGCWPAFRRPQGSLRDAAKALKRA
jgi:hypothetical protein